MTTSAITPVDNAALISEFSGGSSSDVAMMIGRNGFTASAIRNILKAAAQRDNINATLQIVSHEEEQQRLEEEQNAGD